MNEWIFFINEGNGISKNFFYIQPSERENSNLSSKTLFYKDCSFGSVRNLTTTELVLAKLLMSSYQITGII